MVVGTSTDDSICDGMDDFVAYNFMKRNRMKGAMNSFIASEIGVVVFEHTSIVKSQTHTNLSLKIDE